MQEAITTDVIDKEEHLYHLHHAAGLAQTAAIQEVDLPALTEMVLAPQGAEQVAHMEIQEIPTQEAMVIVTDLDQQTTVTQDLVRVVDLGLQVAIQSQAAEVGLQGATLVAAVVAQAVVAAQVEEAQVLDHQVEVQEEEIKQRQS